MKSLIVQIGRIGDMILATPMFRALKEKHSSMELHVLTSAKGHSVISKNPYIDNIIVHGSSIVAIPASILNVRRERYDVWIDPKDHASSLSSMLAQYSGAKKKIGFNKPGKSVFDVEVPSEKENFSLHAIQRNFLALKELGISINTPVPPDLFIGGEIEDAVVNAVHLDKGKPVVVNISAGQASRMWGDDGWSMVIQRCFLKRERVALLFQPADTERAKKLQQEFPDLIIVASPTMDHAIALAKNAACVITVDTSIVHVASAYDIPIIALYPNVDWNYNKFHPLSNKQAVIFSTDPNSLHDIPVESVLEKIEEMIG